LTWAGIGWCSSDMIQDQQDTVKVVMQEEYLAEAAKQLRAKLAEVETKLVGWMQRKVAEVEELDSQCSRDQEELNMLYYQRWNEYQDLKTASKEFLEGKKGELTEALKDLEVLNAKMEYELNTLAPKLNDVDDAVSEFERQVEAVEARAQQLEDERTSKESWLNWTLRILLGTAPKPTLAR